MAAIKGLSYNGVLSKEQQTYVDAFVEKWTAFFDKKKAASEGDFKYIKFFSFWIMDLNLY